MSYELRSTSRESPHILRSPKVHYRVHNRPPFVPILNQINAVETLTSLKSISILSSHLCLGLPSGSFTFFYQTLYALFFPPTRAPRPLPLTISGEQYKSSRRIYLPQHPIFRNFGSVFFLNVRDQVPIPYKTAGSPISSVYFGLHVFRHETIMNINCTLQPARLFIIVGVREPSLGHDPEFEIPRSTEHSLLRNKSSKCEEMTTLLP